MNHVKHGTWIPDGKGFAINVEPMMIKRLVGYAG